MDRRVNTAPRLEYKLNKFLDILLNTMNTVSEHRGNEKAIIVHLKRMLNTLDNIKKLVQKRQT